MQILLVRPCWTTRWLIMPPTSLIYISAAAKKAGHECDIYDAWLKNKEPEEVTDDIQLHGYDIIGIQVYMDTVEWTRKFIQIARQFNSKSKFIIGGPFCWCNYLKLEKVEA